MDSCHLGRFIVIAIVVEGDGYKVNANCSIADGAVNLSALSNSACSSPSLQRRGVRAGGNILRNLNIDRGFPAGMREFDLSITTTTTWHPSIPPNRSTLQLDCGFLDGVLLLGDRQGSKKQWEGHDDATD